MSRGWAGTVLAAVLLLAGCGGGTHPIHPVASASPPASAHAVSTNLPLRRAAERWMHLMAEGRTREVYRNLVSTRCRAWVGLAQFRRWARPPDTSRSFTTYSRGRRGWLAWTFPAGTFTPAAWPWVREDGQWKSDECPGPDPRA